MSTIATLSVGLTANAAGFTAGMDGARHSADLFGSSLRSARSVYDSTRTPAERYAAQLETLQKHFQKGKIDADTYARALKSVEEGYKKSQEPHHEEKGGEGGFGKIAESVAEWELLQKAIEKVSSTLEGAENTERMATTIGISTQELQKLEYAARMTNVPIEAVTSAIGKMDKAIGEVAVGRGSKESAEALKALGLNASDLLREGAPQALGDIADALAKIENPALRDQYAMELLGRSGKELLPILKAGSEGLRKWGQDALNTGFAQSEEDMQKSIKTAEAYKQAQLAAEGAVRSAVASIAPYITWVAKLVEVKGRETVVTLGAAAAVGGAALAYNVARQPVADFVSLIGKIGLTGSLGAAAVLAIGAAAVYTAGQISRSTSFMIELGAETSRTLGINEAALKHYDVVKLNDLAYDLNIKEAREREDIASAKSIEDKIEARQRYIATLRESEEVHRKIEEKAKEASKYGPVIGAGNQSQGIAEARRKSEKELAELQKRRFEAPDGGDPALVKATAAVSAYIDRLREEQEALLSTASAATAEKFARAGAPAALVEEARRRGELVESLKEQKKATDDLAQFSRHLEEQTGGAGHTQEAELADKITKAQAAMAKAREGAVGQVFGGDPLGLMQRIAETGVPAAQAMARLQQEINRARSALAAFEQSKIDEAFSRMADKIREAQAEIHKQTAAQRELDEFIRQHPTATAGQIAGFTDKAAELDRLEILKKSVELAERLAKAGRTPIEVHAENIKALNDALAAGAIKQNEFADGVRKANEELAEQAMHAQKTEFGQYDRANIMLHGPSFQMPGDANGGGPGGTSSMGEEIARQMGWQVPGRDSGAGAGAGGGAADIGQPAEPPPPLAEPQPKTATGTPLSARGGQAHEKLTPLLAQMLAQLEAIRKNGSGLVN